MDHCILFCPLHLLLHQLHQRRARTLLLLGILDSNLFKYRRGIPTDVSLRMPRNRKICTIRVEQNHFATHDTTLWGQKERE